MRAEALAGRARSPFQLEARFSVTNESERYSGKLSWRHAGAADELRIMSPFGQVVAEIEVRPGRATLLAADRQRHEAVDAQTLTRQVLGYPLPIERLADWCWHNRRRRRRLLVMRSGAPLRIVESDWRVEYDYAGRRRMHCRPAARLARRWSRTAPAYRRVDNRGAAT